MEEKKNTTAVSTESYSLSQQDEDVHENELSRVISQYTEYSVMESAPKASDIESDPSSTKPDETKGADVKKGGPPGGAPGGWGAPKHPFFAPQNDALRKRVFKSVGFTLLLMSTLLLGIFSIYWGSMYDRGSRLVNLKTLVVLEDPVDGVYPPLSEALYECMTTAPLNTTLGWKIIGYTSAANEAASKNLSVEEWIVHEIAIQNYWSSVYLNSTASSDLVAALKGADSGFNITGLIRSYYETGRDYQAMNSYVTPQIVALSAALGSYLGSTSYPKILSAFNSTELSKLITNAPQLLTEVPQIERIDSKPWDDYVLLAPSQVGLIYLVILTFFQFMFFIKLHASVAPHVVTSQYFIYRAVCSQFAFLVLSLIYSAVSAAFQVNFNESWKGGFGVQWMVSYLTMSAVGGANENMALIIFSLFSPLTGFWMLFWIIINIAPTFSPLALCPTFYRYGYAMPLHNTYELMKVVLFGITRQQVGRNVGILIAWMVINITLLPFCLAFFAYTIKKNAMKAKQQGGKSGGPPS